VIPVLIILIVAVIVALFVVSIYNRLVQTRNRVDNAWAQVDVELKRRYDLIPNLVETVKGYAAHEREVFERVTEARSGAVAARTPEQQARAENVLTSALRQLFAVAEAYPDLKANQNFQQLQAQLEQTEAQIATARQIYNDTVLTYNNAIQVFPAVILAGMFGFTKRTFFETQEPAEREPVQVDFRDMPGREPASAPSEPPPPASTEAPSSPPEPPAT
jgi:LemA protein